MDGYTLSGAKENVSEPADSLSAEDTDGHGDDDELMSRF
jgi:hypothetical protein